MANRRAKKATYPGCSQNLVCLHSQTDLTGQKLTRCEWPGYEPDIIALGFQELVELSPQQIVSLIISDTDFPIYDV